VAGAAVGCASSMQKFNMIHHIISFSLFGSISLTLKIYGYPVNVEQYTTQMVASPLNM